MGTRTRADLIRDRFGVNSQVNTAGLASVVGASATQLLSNNPNRLALTIVNTSAAALYLHPNNQVTSSLGIVLTAAGGALALNWEDDFDLVGSEWWAIAPVAGATVEVLEVVAI